MEHSGFSEWALQWFWFKLFCLWYPGIWKVQIAMKHEQLWNSFLSNVCIEWMWFLLRRLLYSLFNHFFFNKAGWVWWCITFLMLTAGRLSAAESSCTLLCADPLPPDPFPAPAAVWIPPNWLQSHFPARTPLVQSVIEWTLPLNSIKICFLPIPLMVTLWEAGAPPLWPWINIEIAPFIPHISTEDVLLWFPQIFFNICSCWTLLCHNPWYYP